MGGLDDPKATGRAPPRADLLLNWWERILAGVAVALVIALVVDIVVHF